MVDREDNRSRNLSVAAVFTRLTGEAIKKKKNNTETGRESKSITLMTGCSLLCSLEDDRHSDLPAVGVSCQ